MHLRDPFVILLAIALTASVVPVSLGANLHPVVVDDQEAQDGLPIEAALLEKIELGPRGVIVHLEPGASATVDLLDAIKGFDVRYPFENIDAVYGIAADAATLHLLTGSADVSFIEDAEKPLAYHLDSATVASRAREVWDPSFEPSPIVIDEPSPELLDDQGRTIDGTGIGIAIVDSGFDGTHRDFTTPDKQAGNYLVTPAGVHEAGSYTVQASAHGTYVAGSTAGAGTASGGEYRGAAPGAPLYTFATWRPTDAALVEGTVVQPAIAFDWILSHGATLDPAIRVVVNAWSCADPACDAPDGPQAHLQLAETLAEQGFVVVFAAGNGGGIGLINRVSAEARLDTPGVLGIGANDDQEAGARDDCTKSFSSRGDAFDPATWPDLIAPGDDVWTPQPIFPDRNTHVPAPGPAERRTYVQVSGTSASAGHAAGVVALVLQANPSLTPAEVEHILETTAYEMPRQAGDSCPIPFVRADPSNPFSEANFAAGHGLIDAMEAVQLAQSWDGLPDPSTAPALEVIPGGFIQKGPVVELTQGGLYLSGTDGLSETPPGDAAPTVHVVGDGETAVYTSDPLTGSATLSAAYIELWAGTDMELVITRCGGLEVFAQVDRIDGGSGEVSSVGTGDGQLDNVLPGGPWLKEIPVLFDEEETFDVGDRLRLSLTFGRCHGSVSQLIPSPLVVYSGATATPSRLLFGQPTTDIRPGTFEACQVLAEGSDINDAGCAWIGGPRTNVPMACQNRVMVDWYGPPGSTAIAHCNGAEALCTVPGEPGDPWARCTAESPVPEATAYWMEFCSYTTLDGGQAEGEGFCGEASGPSLAPFTGAP